MKSEPEFHSRFFLHFKYQITIGRHWPYFFINQHFQLVYRSTKVLHSRHYVIMVEMSTLFIVFDAGCFCTHLAKDTDRSIGLVKQGGDIPEQIRLHRRRYANCVEGLNNIGRE